MKLALALLLAGISAFAQGQPAAAPKSGLDKAAIEAYLRHAELWLPQVTVKIDDPQPSNDLAGFSELTVHLSYNGGTADQHYLVSKDGKNIIKGDVYDITKSPFQSNLDKLKTDLQPSFGAAGAPVVAVVFGDFQCPNCKSEAESMRKLIPASYNDKVRVYFKDFPLESIHKWARPAAIAGRCVFRQNPQAFWKYHDWIYSVQPEITPENFNTKLMAWAPEGGVDSLQLGRCLENKQTEAEVNKNIAEGRTLGVDATPTLFLNGRKLVGTLSEDVLRQLIELELEHQVKVADAGEKCCTVTIPSLAGGKK
jgi:protein-disulfide isomerase